MTMFRDMVLAGVLAFLTGCAAMGGKSAPLAIDFQDLTVAGIRPGVSDETVVSLIGHPPEIRYGRSDSSREVWPYYDLGIKVVVDARSREVDEVVVFFNRTRAYRAFRGRIAQGFPLASRVVDVKPLLEGYEETDTEYRGYEEAQVYSDEVETVRLKEEIVSLEKSAGARMTVHFDYDKWLESVVLTRAVSPGRSAEEGSEREEVVVGETAAGAPETVLEEKAAEEAAGSGEAGGESAPPEGTPPGQS